MKLLPIGTSLHLRNSLFTGDSLQSRSVYLSSGAILGVLMESSSAVPNLPHFRGNRPRLRGRGGDFKFDGGTYFFEQVCRYAHLWTTSLVDVDQGWQEDNNILNWLQSFSHVEPFLEHMVLALLP